MIIQIKNMLRLHNRTASSHRARTVTEFKVKLTKHYRSTVLWYRFNIMYYFTKSRIAFLTKRFSAIKEQNS